MWEECSTYICWAHDATYLFHGIEVWAQTTMHSKNLFVNNSCDRETVEAVRKGFPQLDVVPPLAFVVKPVDTIDGSTFVITSENEKILGVFDLIGKKQTDCLE